HYPYVSPPHLHSFPTRRSSDLLHLLGDDGLFRSHRPNTLKAHTDREAVQAWFATLAEKSAATQDSYRRAVERLILWALVERQTPDRKSTRLNSSHVKISYAVFC